MSLVIKAFLKDEIRRIRVPSSSSFGEIELQLRTALAIPSATRITIKYQDEEGDHCVLSPESLTDALSIATAAANHETTPLLKVHITPTSTAPTTTTLATPTVSSATAGMNMLQLELTSDTDKSEIKEWHFHVVFLWSNAEQVRQAEALREKIVAAVASGDLTVVCHGVTTEHFPKLNMNRVPKVNLKPIGPHISASYEVWVPKEGFVTAMSFFTLNRGDVSILIHPLTRWELADHSTRASWIGTQFPLDLGPLVEDLNRIPFQYPDLGLGYSKKQ